jgi:hypothetical protein
MGRELLNLLGSEHRLDRHTGFQLLPHRQPPGHPAPCLQGHARFLRRGHRRDHRHPGTAPVTEKGRRHPLHHPVGRCVRRPRHLHLHGLHAAVPLPEGEIRSRYHLEHLRLRGRQLRIFHLPRDHEAAQFKNVHGGQAPGGQMDSGRRVRPHVAGDQPVHGHHERPGRLPGSAGQPHHRHQIRKRQLHQDGSHRSLPPT